MKRTNTNVIAVDLIDTLVERGKDQLTKRGVQYLAAQGLRLEAADFYASFRKRYLEYSMGNYCDDEEFFRALFAEHHGFYSHEVASGLLSIVLECNRPFPDAGEFLARASKDYTLILASNHVSSWVSQILKANDWQRFFSSILVSSDCRYRKPARGFFKHLIELSPTKIPSEIVLVGDSLVNDVYGAGTEGVRSYLLRRSAPMTSVTHSTEVCSSLLEFLARLSSYQGD